MFRLSSVGVYDVEAVSVEEAVELARLDPDKRTNINIDECVEYDSGLRDRHRRRRRTIRQLW